MRAYRSHSKDLWWAALAAAILLFLTLMVLVTGASPTLASQDPTQAEPQQPPDPYLILEVNYGHDWVEGRYEPSHTVWLTVTDSGGAVKATAELETLEIPWWSPGETGFSTNFDNSWNPSQPDMVAGDWVYGRVDNGRTAEVHLGEITGTVDIDDDTLTGNLYADWLPPPVRLWCSVWADGGPGLESIWVDPEGGEFSCDLGAAGWDLLPGQQVGVTYQEPDGDQVMTAFMEPAPNLQMDKWSEGNGQSYPGGPVVFGLRVQNHGNAPASQVIVTDTLPGNASYNSDTSGVIPDVVGDEVVWELGSLDPGEEIQFYLYLDSTAGADETVYNQADAWALYDQDMNDNHAEAQVQVVAELPDLYVNKNPEVGNPAAGQTMLWRLDYGNQGPVASPSVTLSDTIPADTAIVEWWSENGFPWDEVASNGQLVLEAPSLPGFSGDQLYIRLALDAGFEVGDQLTNTAEILGTPDADPENNWNQRDDVWVGDPYWNASVDKSFGSGILVPGGEMEYNLHARNNGNVVATLTLTDVLPAGTSFVGAWRQDGPDTVSFPPDYDDSEVAVWNLGLMEPGDWVNLQVRLAIAAETPVGTQLENCARVAMDHGDQWPLDNESCHLVQVNAPGPNLAIEKYYQWNGDGQLEYGIQLYNLGTTLLSNGSFTDTLPADTTFHDSWWAWFQEPVTLTHQADGELAWTFRRMEPGWSAGLAFQVDLAGELVGMPGLAFTNTVEVPVAGDVTPADNIDMVTAYTGPDLYVKKHHSGGEPVPGGLITFTVEFGNANGGPWGTSAGTHLTDTLPAATTFVTATAPWDPSQGWSPVMTDGGTVVWEWWNIDPGNTLFFDIVAEIDPEAGNGDVLVNTIQVASDAPDQDVEYDYSNNTDEATVGVMAGHYIYLPIVSRDF